MSDAGTLVDKLTTIIETAVTGVTVSKEAAALDAQVPESFPFCVLLQTGYEVAPLDFQQETRTWTFSGAIFVNGETDTRETVQAHLEAIRDGVAADPTLTGSVDLATTVIAAADDSPDSPFHAGDFEITGELVV